MLSSRLADLLRQVKLKASLKLVLVGLNWLILSWLMLTGINQFMHATIPQLSVLLSLFVWFIWLSWRRPLKRYSSCNVLLHANHQLPQLQQSAQLLVKSDDKLNLLQRLQKQRIANVIAADWDQFYRAVMATVSWRNTLASAAMLLLGVVVINVIPYSNEPLVAGLESTDEAQLQATPISHQFGLEVHPPAYTELPAVQSSATHTKVVEGSTVSWQVRSSEPINALDYTVVVGNEGLAMNAQSAQDLVASEVVTRSSIYHFTRLEQVISDIYSLEVIRDQRPQTQLLAPQNSVTQFVQDSQPVVNAKVRVSDDYGLTKVYIEASIAKGSGEAVKFRDAVFEFDTATDVTTATTGVAREYEKQWLLSGLGMEPGDEFYFTVIAIDNKQPQAQEARSETRIIRWLDENVDGVTSEGIVIDFMPEYFKSQRQIIIETNALIEQREQLTKAEFDKVSRDLGMAQSDLKHRYGQYLGDEFESGVMQTMEQGPVHDNHEHEGEGHDEQGSDEHSHAHDSEVISTQTNADRSGFTEVIEQFGHDHGEVDVGFNSLRKGEFSPKVLMKQSIANMWQAELFLLLSEPERALPFEEKALDFLNRAKQADRVYVQRLGFEPPPVTENRRYQGDLSDIPALSRLYEIELTKDREARARELLLRLNQVTVYAAQDISPSDQQLLQQVSSGLQEALANAEQDQTESGALLQALTNIQRLLVAREWQSSACSSCALDLQLALYQWLPPLNAPPRTSGERNSSNHPLVQHYQSLEAGQ